MQKKQNEEIESRSSQRTAEEKRKTLSKQDVIVRMKAVEAVSPQVDQTRLGSG